MKIIKAYLIAATISAAVLLVVFGISRYYGEEQPVPVISYIEEAAFYDKTIERIELNTATTEELIKIEGIGRSTAEKIVAYAEKVGFLSVEDLLDIDGIGQKTYEAIRPYVTVSVENWKETRATEALISENEPEITDVYMPSFPIDLNSAALEDLLFINGIGEVTAGKIIDYANNTGFYSVDDLIKIDGIGKKKLEAIRPYVTVIAQNTTETSSTDVYENQNQIDLNTATIEELMTINGIGQATAEKIVDYARTSGFNSVEDLLNINGIGEKKLESIRPYVTV